ncbi:cation efflux protein [Polychaeton citri CBS 116435]|uniref:Cation efflux protein n=1 Tax=Polychaeton citri CBS 116435 TaxID=1314669 RepID=A0A9P4UQU3_9PEZI|nr:cation efflux protein [Polychaeton citri CBS 116435]
MALSKSSRIIILLIIDIAFFLLEIVVGYAVHSLALVADSFHMLNDVLSLFVGLWAVRVANKKANSSTYTYGWQRAETLGALVNGVFLVALCVTIFLDAIQRFVEPQVVSNPRLVLVVGCLGLMSNILGLFLFHEHGHGHGHSHGGHSHDENEDRIAEEGHAHDHDHDHAHPTEQPTTPVKQPGASGNAQPQDEPSVTVGSPSTSARQHRRTRSRASYTGFDDIYVNPYSFRQSIVAAGNRTADEMLGEDAMQEEQDDSTSPDDQPLLNGNKANGYGAINGHPIDHDAHNHRKPRDQSKGGHGHSHGDLNMRGVFLHVMGDALGNVGVIVTALFIWLTDWPWRYYLDPAISLIITVIILCSAIPLCKAASRILLQAVPLGIDVEDIKDDICNLPGIVSCHHVHVWQLSDTKLVASLHVQVGFDFKGDGSARYMQLAQAIRKCLHEYGIHSSTIQPEFCLDPDHTHTGTDDGGEPGVASTAGSVCEPDSCLLECGDDCDDVTKACCVKPAQKKDTQCGHDHGTK